MGIGRHDSNAGDPQTFEIIHIISDVGDLIRRETFGCHKITQGHCLIPKALLDEEIQFPASSTYDSIRFRREDCCVEPVFQEALDAKAIGPAAVDCFDSGLADVNRVVCENTIEIKNKEPNWRQ
jgi:hypothetical protein